MELERIQKYLYHDLGMEAVPAPVEVPGVPFFIKRQFDLYKLVILDKELCFLVSKKQSFSRHSFQEVTSAVAFFQGISGCLPVFVFPTMSKQERLELVASKVSV